MAKRISLREYQEGMIARLQGATATSQADARLGVEIGNNKWLLDLGDVAEVLPVPQVASVPLAQPWFKGVANVRGSLMGVVDVQAYFGEGTMTANPLSRLLLLHQQYLPHAGILVGRMLGLRHLAEMTEVPLEGTNPSWMTGAYQDSSGVVWKILGIPQLVAEPTFLRTGIIG